MMNLTGESCGWDDAVSHVALGRVAAIVRCPQHTDPTFKPFVLHMFGRQVNGVVELPP